MGGAQYRMIPVLLYIPFVDGKIQIPGAEISGGILHILQGGGLVQAIAEPHIEYEDGSEEVVCTDGSWEYQGSLVEDSGIYDGEIFNELLWEGKENPWKPAIHRSIYKTALVWMGMCF